MKVLCFQPHNDDCAIAIGGTMQKMLRQGWELTYGYVTDGRHGSDVIPSEELIGIRRGEAAEERGLLGIHHFVELGVEDGSLGKLRGLQLESVKQRIASTLEASKADLVLLPTRSDMHPDHRASHDIVVRVMEDMKLTPLLVKYFVWLFPDFYKKLPDISERVLMVGIDGEMTQKMAAIRLHQSQVSKGSFDSMVQTLNAYLAYAFRAPADLGARYVEVIGLGGAGRRARKMRELLRALEPCADVTDMFHGRPSQRIRARL